MIRMSIDAKELNMATEIVGVWLTSFPPWLAGHNAHVLAGDWFHPEYQ